MTRLCNKCAYLMNPYIDDDKTLVYYCLSCKVTKKVPIWEIVPTLCMDSRKMP